MTSFPCIRISLPLSLSVCITISDARACSSSLLGSSSSPSFVVESLMDAVSFLYQQQTDRFVPVPAHNITVIIIIINNSPSFFFFSFMLGGGDWSSTSKRKEEENMLFFVVAVAVYTHYQLRRDNALAFNIPYNSPRDSI